MDVGVALAPAWVCGTLLAGASAAQHDNAVTTFADVIDVRVVNVEVVVTDDQGRPVHGLTAADFELLVDGRPVPLDYFSEIREGRAVAAPVGDVPAVPALRPNAPVGTSFLVFIDDFFSIKRDRDRVLDRLEDDLVKLAPSDRVAIVAFDGTSIAKLTGWTNSSDRLTAALEEARGREAHGLDRLKERMASEAARGEQILLRREGAETFARHGESRAAGVRQSGHIRTLLQARNPQNRRGNLEDTSQGHDVRSNVLDGVSETGRDASLDLLNAARLEVWIAAMDETGNRSETSFQTFRIAGDYLPEPGQIHYIGTGLELHRRERRFVIAVHDPRSGAILTSSGMIDRR